MKRATTDLQIRGIPTKVRDRLRVKAESNGKSMSEYLIELISKDVDRLTLDEWIGRLRARPVVDLDVDVAALIRKERDARETQLSTLIRRDLRRR